MSNRIITFSDGFTSTTAPTGVSAVETYTIANNTSGGTLFTMAQATNKSAFIDYELRRTSSGGTFLQAGSIILAYDGAWSLAEGNFQGDDMLQSTITSTEQVKLIFNSSSGVLTYDSGNLAGTSYVGTLKISIMRVA